MKQHVWIEWMVVGVILLFFIIISVASSLRESLTFDEIVYIQGGRSAWISHVFTVDPYNPPFSSELATLPYVFSQSFQKSELVALKNSLPARTISILWGVLLLTSIYLFTKRMAGKVIAFFATGLLSFEPNVLANSHYITIDIAVTALFFMSYWTLLEVMQKSSLKKLLLLCISIGLGMATKITFLPFFFTSAGALWFINGFGKRLLQWKYVFFVVGISFLVVWATYFFTLHVAIKGDMQTNRFSAKTITFAKQHHMPLLSDSVIFLQRAPIPLGDYLAILKNNTLRAGENSQCFSLGVFSMCQWYFMSTTFFLKTPLPLFIFFGISLVACIKKRNRKFLITVIPVVSILGLVMLLRMAPLMRYILPLMPFLVIAGSLSLPFFLKSWKRITLLVVLLIWYIGGTLMQFPHFLSFANEFTFDQKAFLLTDSNMDWGQSLPNVESFMRAHHVTRVSFSYFGRDNGDWYHLKSNIPYGSYKNNEICEFHEIGDGNKPIAYTLISATNWYACGYNKTNQFKKGNIKEILANSIFVFNQ